MNMNRLLTRVNKYQRGRGLSTKAEKTAKETHRESRYWNNEPLQREVLERFGREHLGVKELDDWYSVKSKDVHNKFRFVRALHGSLSNALKNLYPHHDWDASKFLKVPKGYWTEEAQRRALERFGREKFGVKELDDWYSVSINVKTQLSFMGNLYNNSLFYALTKLYPNHNWDPLRFSKVPKGFWTEEETQKEALERLGREKFGVKELDDWYSVSATHVYRELCFVSQKYGSLFDALKSLYPHHNWDPMRFAKLPRIDEDTQREALERLGEKLGVKELDDWYSVETVNVRRDKRFKKLRKYKTLYNALKTLYPHHNWDPNRFARCPRIDENTQRLALEKLGREKLGVKELDDWYSASADAVYKHLGFINKYGSLFEALKTLYPHHDWNPLRFPRVPKGYWQQPSTVQYYHKLFIELKKSHQLQTITDWHELPPEHLEVFKRASVGIFGSKMKMLQEWFPEVVWQWQFTSQLELKNLVKHVIANASTKHHRYGYRGVMLSDGITGEDKEYQGSVDNQWNNAWSKVVQKLKRVTNHRKQQQ